jgi:hypothetical protein
VLVSLIACELVRNGPRVSRRSRPPQAIELSSSQAPRS